MLYLVMITSWVSLYSVLNINFGSQQHAGEFLISICWVFFAGANIGSIITHFSLYINQCKDLENLNKIKSDKRIFKERANMFLAQIKNLLVEVYPSYEKDIFTKITTQSASTILSVYPDIKSNQTITDYINRLIEFDDKAYQCDLEMNDTINNIEVRKRISKLWVYSGFVPITSHSKDYQKFYE